MSKNQGNKCESSENLTKKGIHLFNKKEFVKAITTLKEAIDLDPKNICALYFRGASYSKIEEVDNALKDFDNAINQAPEFAPAYLARSHIKKINRQYECALEDLEKYISLSPNDKSTYLINSGHVLFRSGILEKALQKYEEALQLDISDEEKRIIDFFRSQIYRNLGQIPLAIKLLTELIKEDPKNFRAYEERAKAFDSDKKSDLALKDFNEVINIDPSYPLAYLNRGLFFRKQGLYKQALVDFKHVKNDSCKNIRSWAHLQSAIIFKELLQYDKALNEYDLALSYNPKFFSAYINKGCIYANLLEYAEAISCFDKAIEVDKTEAISYLNRGVINSTLGNYKEALDDFKSAIKLDNKYGYAFFGKARTICLMTKAEMSYKQKKAAETLVLKTLRKALKNGNESDKKLFNWWIDFCKKYFDASEENRKRLKAFAEIYEEIVAINFFDKLAHQKDRLDDFLSDVKTIDQNDCYFLILRRWNSYTPVIPGEYRSNLGGGYFFVCDGKGTVIDPGYNFLENFIEYGYSIGDIDNVILTHAHDDHTAAFESMLSLFAQCAKTKKKKIKLFVNIGAFVKFSSLVSKSENFFEKITVLNIDDSFKLSPSLNMLPTPTDHKDVLTENTARGIVFTIKKGSKKIKIGITGDTKLKKDFNGKSIFSFFENLDLLILHIGSIHQLELTPITDNFDNAKYDGQHLGIRGIINIIFNCRPKIAAISEFGEELKRLRTTIADTLDNKFENFNSNGFTRVLPADIGLKINFNRGLRISCEYCDKNIQLKDVKYSDVLINNKIAYHCRTHQRNEIIKKFLRKEEEDLRIRAEKMGCTLEGLTLDSSVNNFISSEEASRKHGEC